MFLHPAAFSPKKHSPAEFNYGIYDKKLVVIVRVFDERRPEVQCSRFKYSRITGI